MHINYHTTKQEHLRNWNCKLYFILSTEKEWIAIFIKISNYKYTLNADLFKIKIFRIMFFKIDKCFDEFLAI